MKVLIKKRGKVKVRQAKRPRDPFVPHAHSKVVEGCFRCELSRDEVADLHPHAKDRELLRRARYRIAALEEEAEEHYQEGYTDGQHDSADVARIAALEGALRKLMDAAKKKPGEGTIHAAIKVAKELRSAHARRVLEGKP